VGYKKYKETSLQKILNVSGYVQIVAMAMFSLEFARRVVEKIFSQQSRLGKRLAMSVNIETGEIRRQQR